MARVAIYTIALNEQHFVQRWFDSAKGADFLMVADTGSTDNTKNECFIRGIYCPSISVKPWRFDDARNASLALIPDDIDYCIVLDMDEVLSPGWREELERCHALGATRLRYIYVWSHNPDGSNAIHFYRDGLHARHGYRWVHPIHEVLMPDRIEEKLVESKIEVHHWPDHSKPRSQYLPLLAQSVKEDPNDDRNAHYYARELVFHRRYQEAAEQFRKHLNMPTAQWRPERASSMRYLAQCEPENAILWLEKAIAETPERREPYVDLARVYYEKGMWVECLSNCEKALTITERPLEYLCDSAAWGYAPYDLAAISCYRLGKYEDAVLYGQKALDACPYDSRLQSNMLYYNKRGKE